MQTGVLTGYDATIRMGRDNYTFDMVIVGNVSTIEVDSVQHMDVVDKDYNSILCDNLRQFEGKKAQVTIKVIE